MIKDVNVSVYNAPTATHKYIVARLVDGKLWYWGSWSDRETAENVARSDDIGGNGLVVEC